MTKLIIIFCCATLTGCAIVKDARSEFRKEMVGFKDNWDRYILKKDAVNERTN